MFIIEEGQLKGKKENNNSNQKSNNNNNNNKFIQHYHFV